MSGYRGMRRRLVIQTLVFVVSSLQLCADDTVPDVSPVSLIGESAAICLEVPNVEKTWSDFLKSPLASRLKKFPPAERLLSGPGFAKWTALQEYSRRVTGKTLSEQLIEAFAESIVVAIYLPEGKTPQGILIGKSRTEESLKQALQSWMTLDPNHVVQNREHHGQSYVRRAKSTSSSDVVYYATFGRTFVLSDHESLVQEAIDKRALAIRKVTASPVPTSTVRTLGDLELFRTNRERLPKDASAFLFVNVRAWERALENEIQKSPDAVFIRQALRSVSGLGLSLHLGNEAVFNLVTDVNSDARSTSWKHFVSGTKRDGEWARRIPSESVLSISGHLAMRPLIEAWLTIFAPSKSPDFVRTRSALNSALLGQDFFLDVLPGLLHDWTVTVCSVDDASKSLLPIEIQGQFAVPGESSSDHKLSDSLDNALHFAMNLAALHYSVQAADPEKPLVSRTAPTSAGLVRSLVGFKGWSPSYLLGVEQLVVASNSATLSPAQNATQTPNARFVSLERRHFSNATQLIWLDALRLRNLINRHGAWLSAMLTPDSAGDRERVRTHLNGIHEVIKLFDTAFVAARFEEDHAHVVFGVSLDRND